MGRHISITVSVEDEEVDRLDDLVDNGEYESRSKAVQEGIRRLTKNNED